MQYDLRYGAAVQHRYAGTFLLFARTDQEQPGSRGVSAFILDGDHVEVENPRGEKGAHALQLCVGELELELQLTLPGNAHRQLPDATAAPGPRRRSRVNSP